MFKSTLAAGLAAYAAANSVPIYGTYPGWIQGGGKASIELEFFIDFLCADTKANYPNVKAALETEVAPGVTYMDGLTVKVSNFPLDYHIHSW